MHAGSYLPANKFQEKQTLFFKESFKSFQNLVAPLLPFPLPSLMSQGRRPRADSSTRRGTFFGSFPNTNMSPKSVSSAKSSPSKKRATNGTGATATSTSNRAKPLTKGGRDKERRKDRSLDPPPVARSPPRKNVHPEKYDASYSVASSSAPSSPPSPTALSLRSAGTTSPPLESSHSPPHNTTSTVRHSQILMNNNSTLSSSMELSTNMQSLQEKLVKITVALEDRAATVRILQEELNRLTADGERRQRDIGEKLRAEFKEKTEVMKNEIEAGLSICDDLTLKKRSLASDVANIQSQISSLEKSIAEKVHSIREKGERQIREAAATWGEGESVRRQKWLERKTVEIRETTIKGLEPEVERLIEKHKQDVSQLQRQHEQKKKDWLVLHMHRSEDAKLVAQKEATDRYDEILTQTRRAGDARLDEVNSAHANALSKLRERLSSELQNQRSWQASELRRMASDHAEDLAAFRSTESTRISEMRRRWEEELTGMKQSSSAHVSRLVNDAAALKEAWESRTRSKIVKESSERMEKVREQMKEDRDREIERAIRKNQSRAAKAESGGKEMAEDKSKQAKVEHNHKVKSLKDKIDRWNERIREARDAVNSANSQKAAHQKSLTALEEHGAKVEIEIGECGKAREEALAGVAEEEEKIGGERVRELKILGMERNRLDLEIAKRRSEVEREMGRQRDRREAVEGEHEKDLEAIERRVKIEVGAKDQRLRELTDAVNNGASRVEITSEMIENYRKRSRGKAVF